MSAESYGMEVKGSIVSTDKARTYPSALRELNVAAHRAFDSKDRKFGTVNPSTPCALASHRSWARSRGLHQAPARVPFLVCMESCVFIKR